MNNLTIEELESILSSYTNEDIYQNLIIRLDDGTGVGLSELQERYNELLAQKNANNINNTSTNALENLTVDELGSILDSYTNEDIYQNLIIRLDDGTGVGLSEIQERYNELINQTQKEINLEELSLDELINLYASNSIKISSITANSGSIFSYGLSKADEEELSNLRKMQDKIVDEIRKNITISDVYLGLSNDELLALRSNAYSELESLSVSVMDSGEASNQALDNLRDDLVKKLKEIDNILLLKNKQLEIKNNMVNIIKNEKVDVNNVVDIDINEYKEQKNLTAEEIESFNREKVKFDLLNSFLTSKKENVINNNEKIDELLIRYANISEKIANLMFSGNLTDEIKKNISDLQSEQKLIIDKINDYFRLTEELEKLSIEELKSLEENTIQKLNDLINPVMDSGEAATEEEQKMKDELTNTLKSIKSEFEFRRIKDELMQRMADLLNNAVDVDGNTVSINNYSKEEALNIDPNNASSQLDENDKDLFNRNKTIVSLLNTLNRDKKVQKEKDKDVGVEFDDKKEIIPMSEIVDESRLLDPPSDEIKLKESSDVVEVDSTEIITVSFMNCGRAIENYYDLKVPVGQIIHGPVYDPEPLNNEGKPKKITAKVFDCWVDQNGNQVDLSQPITSNVVLSAQYKFDKKKAVSVGLGAAVGTVAYISDLAVPTPVPVVSMVGAAGFSFASRKVSKNLKNIQTELKGKAMEISAFEEIPEELKEEIEEAKNTGYFNTFLKTAAIACTVSSAAHGIKNRIDASNATKVANSNMDVNHTVTMDGSTNPPIDNPVVDTSSIPTPTTGSENVTQVFNGYTPDGKVFKTAQDALNNVGGFNAYTPAFNGNETFEVLYNGVRYPIEKGQSISSILESIGATDPSQVAVNVMNADGVPLTWQSLADLTVNAADKVSGIIK